LRDCRGLPEFVFNLRKVETAQEAFDLKGNPSIDLNWWRTKYATDGAEHNFTFAHSAITGGRFRKDVKAIKPEDATTLTLHDEAVLLIMQDEVVHRRVFDPSHRSFVTNFGSYIKAGEYGKTKFYAVSRQMVLFAVERREARRILQSKAGATNKDYLAQKSFLAKIDNGGLLLANAKTRARELLTAALATLK
jgi:pyruvate-ferredoxin/flavodoxin oxidoreductase